MNDVAYEAFFDELGQIEKRAMLEKAAVVAAARTLGQVVSPMVKHPARMGKVLKNIYQSGAKAAPKGSGTLTRVGKGVGKLWGTQEGRVAILGGGAALGAGTIGAGALAGRQAGRSSAAPGF